MAGGSALAMVTVLGLPRSKLDVYAYVCCALETIGRDTVEEFVSRVVKEIVMGSLLERREDLRRWWCGRNR